MNGAEQASPLEVQPPSDTLELDADDRIQLVKQHLAQFSSDHQLPNLAARTKRGLDPIGIIALPEYRPAIETICQALGTTTQALTTMTVDIQKNGPWSYANAFAEASDPTTKAWMILRTADDRSHRREMDLTPQEFLKELTDVRNELSRAQADSTAYFAEARNFLLADSQTQFRLEQGVPISEFDSGFIEMAVNGYSAGVIQDADGLLFVGMRESHDEVMQTWGLHLERRDDPDRGQFNVPYWVNDRGEALIKQLHPGFLIILSRSFELAKALVQATMAEHPVIHPEALGHTVYEPTSAQKLDTDSHNRQFKPTRRIPEQEATEDFRDQFYASLYNTKTSTILRDSVTLFRQKQLSKGKPFLSPKIRQDIESLTKKTAEKNHQKIDELKYMMGAAEQLLQDLPAGMKVMDMAGGAGDLGLATTMELMAAGKPPKETDIIDPFIEASGLGVFGQHIIERLPRADEFRQIMKYEPIALQEAKITPDAVVVAKHACGDLTDSIIEQWVNSESPALVIMTCCQDKAKDQPARYSLSQQEWGQLCRDSAKTNSPKPEQRAEGMAAMTRLDEARLAYLRRYGFEATLTQTDQFPKGDVIVARRKVKPLVQNVTEVEEV